MEKGPLVHGRIGERRRQHVTEERVRRKGPSSVFESRGRVQGRAPALQRGRRRKKPLRECQTLQGQGECSQGVTVAEMPGQAGVWRGAKGNRDLLVLKITRGPTPTFRGKKEKGSELWAEKQNLKFCLFSWSLGSYHSPPPVPRDQTRGPPGRAGPATVTSPRGHVRLGVRLIGGALIPTGHGAVLV